MNEKWRDGIDLVAITVINIMAGIVAGMAVRSVGPVGLFTVPLIGIGAVFALLRLRKQSWPAIGLRSRPALSDLGLGIAIGLAFLAITFGAEQMGLSRDLSSIREQVAGGAGALAMALLYAIVGAALYEEITFRGFFMLRIASLFGGSMPAWLVANAGQAIVFGLVHAQQGLAGMVYTSALAFVLGLVFLRIGRNLWPLIIGHAVYDCLRYAGFYISS